MKLRGARLHTCNDADVRIISSELNYTSMAHPFYLIDDALRCFYRQWNSGLQPKLSLLTHSDGSIMISTEVDSQISDYDPSSHAHKTSVGDSSSHRRRSGRNSRIRRRYLRSKDQVNVSASSDLTDSIVPVNANEACSEALPVECIPLKEEIVLNAISHDDDLDLSISKISLENEVLDREVRIKDEQIMKLEMELSRLKFKLSYLNDYCTNVYG